MTHAPRTSTRSTCLLACASVLLALCLLPRDVGHAATFSVDDPRDLPDANLQDNLCLTTEGTCTLRAAVEQSNADTALDSINIREGTYVLTEGPLNIVTSMSLRGVTEDTTVIRKFQEDPAHPVPEGVIRIGSREPRIVVASVSLSRLTLTGGGGFVRENFPTGATGGAIINNEGSRLALERVKVVGNEALQGGGIANLGSLILRRSTISGNFAGGRGFNASGGGGLTNGQQDLLTTSLSAFAFIEESTISGNTADKEGGGMTNVGSLTMTNSTISGNLVTGEATFTTGGGGIFNAGDTALRSVTLTDNEARSADGGGVFNTGGGFVTMVNTILAENQASNGDDCFGAVNSEGFNLIGTDEDCIILRPFEQVRFGIRDIVGVVDPGLLPLADNGGPTQTHALCLGPGQPPASRVELVCLEASPAIDPVIETRLGPLANTTCPSIDQRGFIRPPLTQRTIQIPPELGGPRVIRLAIGPHASCDIGAFDAFATAP